MFIQIYYIFNIIHLSYIFYVNKYRVFKKLNGMILQTNIKRKSRTKINRFCFKLKRKIDKYIHDTYEYPKIFLSNTKKNLLQIYHRRSTLSS